MNVKEAILRTLDERMASVVEPKQFDYDLCDVCDLDVTESAIHAACRKLVKDGVMEKISVWHGRDFRYRQARYYTAYRLKAKANV